MSTGLIRIGRRTLVLALGAILAACSYGASQDRRTDFVLFFAGTSTDLDPAANLVLDRAARAAAELDVTVAGYVDAPVTPESNQITSRIRAQIVANALVQRGVERGRIRLAPRRAIGADPGVESHRVEIRIGS